MTTSAKLQNMYIKLYTILREYSWPMYVVTQLADIELETFKSFPDLHCLYNMLDKFYYTLYNSIPNGLDQTAVNQILTNMMKVVDSNTLYYKIHMVNEVI